MFLVVLFIKWCVLIINTVKKKNLYRRKDAVNKFIKLYLNEYNYCKKVIKKHSSKNLIMTAEENEKFEITNICGFVIN